MTTRGTSQTQLGQAEVARLIEEHGEEVLRLVAAALRREAPDAADSGGGSDMGPVARDGGVRPPVDDVAGGWRRVGLIEGFDHQWPEVHEHYGPMPVWERRDGDGLVRLAIGRPRERVAIYGRERGWVSVWEVINGQPREQRAVFVEANDFDSTGDRVAVISGKGGDRKAGFARGEESLLPDVYRTMRIDVHRDRCSGPYAKDRLAVVASDQEAEAMLDHARAHVRLRR